MFAYLQFGGKNFFYQDHQVVFHQVNEYLAFFNRFVGYIVHHLIVERILLAEAVKANDEKAAAEIKSHIHHRFVKGEVLPDFTGFKPNYFNSGCCCFSDGDITGIEISDGCIRLIKWEYDSSDTPQRIVLEEATLGKVAVAAKAEEL